MVKGFFGWVGILIIACLGSIIGGLFVQAISGRNMLKTLKELDEATMPSAPDSKFMVIDQLGEREIDGVMRIYHFIEFDNKLAVSWRLDDDDDESMILDSRPHLVNDRSEAIHYFKSI